jgi:hypothetical protein
LLNFLSELGSLGLRTWRQRFIRAFRSLFSQLPFSIAERLRVAAAPPQKFLAHLL